MEKWNIIVQGFDPKQVTKHESLFSLGNGAMGCRANFEEQYTGETFQGSYIGGVYYPDKTKVGWWKNGYPEYFAKVLNAPSWLGINISINNCPLDLNTCIEVKDFRRQLNMKEGWYERSFTATLPNEQQVQVKVQRLLSLRHDAMGALHYQITPLTADAQLQIESYLDSGVKNNDANWDEHFWNTLAITHQGNRAAIIAETKKTKFKVCTFMQNALAVNQQPVATQATTHTADNYISKQYEVNVKKGDTLVIEKIGGYVTAESNTENALLAENTFALLNENIDFTTLLQQQKEDWAAIWETADIEIDGDVKAQQAIRFNIFQLNQTYSGKHSQLNIGPKGFTGEKYGGSTYWDTEAYCLPFYMATKSPQVARNLLLYRYKQLPQAIANAQKLGFSQGAALYPMVTMNGEECHNEWEITFEEIHRNGAIAFAIYNYVRYTGDSDYIKDYGIEVLIGIARFWAQRVSFSAEKEKYVILGVTGPNEYENNVNNNFYTNYIAAWCLRYAAEQVNNTHTTQASADECKQWLHIADNIYLPYSEKYGIYLQQDGFLDKELKPTTALSPQERPINQHWSWDRILRSPYIKQADTLQGFYFFQNHFSKEALQKHYDFYSQFTVHESSLSPCVHSILAAKLGMIDEAYQLYLRTARLDLDDYNKEVHEGLHITSMAGTWLSIVEGFGGLQVEADKLTFAPQIPPTWQRYSFKVFFRSKVYKVEVLPTHHTVTIL
ncbi:glycosyl hydrolase family 65 central catalytic domain protein [Capnocytophaga sp. oral taxon 332 str. F0381]|uniref:family 65 glycosyl hydrolase domain-containing protein n=1 Tax=Capnocytophaga sp. oral taxon 332 TaxID=712213 RepID=UPI0002A39E71|nr:family 65 glycosyl hydrolase domain-containing protein [Capnocytophaga sp. oral taxon 332]EKY11598.1 glycosyl hydrolase family 65 central catalytic domain protein [Capnocytophaga sp. oral taxon 332 str. F0381]